MKQFMFGILSITNDERTSYGEKFTLIVNSYIDMLIVQPDMPIFVLSEIQRDPSGLNEKMRFDKTIMDSVFMNQLREAMQAGEIEDVSPIHIMMNIIGLSIFPFIGSPIFKKIGGLGEEQFVEMMQQRKTLIPGWILGMIKKK